MRHPLIYVPKYYEQKNPFEIGYGVKAGPCKFKVEVAREGRATRKPFGDEWFPNLITNSGLDQLAQGISMYGFYNNTFLLFGARVGTGTNPPAVTDTNLQALTQSTQTIFTGGNCTTAIDTVNGTSTTTTILEFPAVASPVTLNELGLAKDGTTGTAIQTRALFPSGVSLNAGDNLRLTYAATESIPCTVTPITVSLAAVNGFNISGQIKVAGPFGNIFGSINANGSTNVIGAGNALHYGGSGAHRGQMLSAPTTFPAVNTAPAAPTVIAEASSESYGTYTTGSFTRTHQMIWVPSNPAATVSNVNGFSWAQPLSGGPTLSATLWLILTSAQTKANTNTLTINTSITVARA